MLAAIEISKPHDAATDKANAHDAIVVAVEQINVIRYALSRVIKVDYRLSRSFSPRLRPTRYIGGVFGVFERFRREEDVPRPDV
jgi:hypothetical protein